MGNVIDSLDNSSWHVHVWSVLIPLVYPIPKLGLNRKTLGQTDIRWEDPRSRFKNSKRTPKNVSPYQAI